MTHREIETKYEPKVRGLYFARRYLTDDSYRFVVQVEGEAPFLKIWQVMDVIERKMIREADFVFYCWGPKIETPEVPKEEIQKETHP